MPNKLEEAIARAEAKPPPKAAPKNKPKKKKPTGRGGATVAAQRPFDIEGCSRDRWEAFAHTYIFGNQEKEILPFHGTESYMLIFGCKYDSARANAPRLLQYDEFKPVLAKVAQRAWTRHGLDENAVAQAWLGIYHANIFDYFTAGEGEHAGQIVLRAKELTELPVAIQQNVKKMKVVNRWIDMGEDRPDELQQTIEIEIVDRLGALNSIARWRGMFAEQEASDINKVAEAIRRRQAKLREAAMTFDGETGEQLG